MCAPGYFAIHKIGMLILCSAMLHLLNETCPDVSPIRKIIYTAYMVCNISSIIAGHLAELYVRAAREESEDRTELASSVPD